MSGFRDKGDPGATLVLLNKVFNFSFSSVVKVKLDVLFTLAPIFLFVGNGYGW